MESPVIIGAGLRSPWLGALNERFRGFAHHAARASGSPWAFTLGVLCVALWALTGHWFGYSEGWQLVINTGTTIVTFLMVFLIQATQNRDAEATQVKLDELLRITVGAHNALLDLEELEEDELDLIRKRYVKLAKRARDELREGHIDTDAPDVE